MEQRVDLVRRLDDSVGYSVGAVIGKGQDIADVGYIIPGARFGIAIGGVPD